MRLRSRALIGLALATACVLAVCVHTPLAGGTRQISTFRRTAGENWFTVMGHVGKPQTYKLPTSSPALVDFVRFAGDLNETASGQVRVVRNGRVAVRLRFSPTSTEKLIPGDVVIIDGKTSQGRIFRGRNSDAAAGPIQISLIGIRPWPIVMETVPERATIRWINQQLGQAEAAASHVKAILPRNFAQRDIDTRLGDGTVLIFDPAWVDVSRLPANLPKPIDATRPPEPQSRPEAARPPAPLPLPIGPGLAERAGPAASTVPGHSAVPTPAPITAQPEARNNRDDEEFTREILTHPNSVPLESRGGPSRPEAGHSRVTDQPAGRPAPNPTVDARIAPRPDTIGSGEESVDEIESPLAEPPYSSYVDQPVRIDRGHPVPEITDTGDAIDEGPEPGLVPEPDALTEIQPPSADAPTVDEPETPSLALQGAAAASTLKPGSTPDDDGASRSGIGSGPLQPELPTTKPQLETDTESASTDSGMGFINARNWPATAITIIGCVGLVAAVFMVLSILMQSPEPQPQQVQPQPTAHSDRYWLDRIINNEMPIEDEPVQIAADEPLFGRPARLVRVDEPHASIPKPHFLKRGGQSGGIPVTPGAPDEPQPEQSDDDKRDKRPTTYAPDRRDRTTTRRPVIPAAPAATAEQPGIVEEISTTAAPAAPKFRIDTAHPATHESAAAPPKKRVPGSRPGRKLSKASETEQRPHDESPLDRILFQVDQGGRL